MRQKETAHLEEKELDKDENGLQQAKAVD